jgi:hypothetical protein
MKIRGLLAGLSFALVLAACGSGPTLPSPASPASDPATSEAPAQQTPPPPDSTGIYSTGGGMGSGN